MDTMIEPTRAADYRAAGYWTGETLDARFRAAAAVRSDEVAIVDEYRRVTFGELAQRVSRLAGALRDLGVGKGDVISLQLPNVAEFVESHLAAERLGAITNPMLTQYRSHDLAKMLDPLQSRVAILPAVYRSHDHLAMWAELAADRDHLEHLLVVGADGDLPAGAHHFEQLVGSAAPLPAPTHESAGDDVTLIIFTSGTVASKGVMHTHDTSLYGIRSYTDELLVDDRDVVWMPSPISHGTGLQWGVRTSMAQGCKLVLQDRWDAETAAALISAEGCTVTMGATPFVYDLRALGPDRSGELASMRHFVCAGAPIPREVMVAVDQDLGLDVLRAYGMSEHFVSTMCRPSDPQEKRIATDGRPFLGTEVAVFDEQRAQQLPHGSEGELAVRGPGVAVGYVNDPERTAETWTADGWQFTDDLAVIDADGFVSIVGRRKDLIIRGGINISPSEIEALLLEHPSVAEVGVVGVPDQRLGERICAVVVPAGSVPTLEDLTAFLLERGVSRLKLPESLVLRDALPRTPSGKIKKDLLRDDVAQ